MFYYIRVKDSTILYKAVPNQTRFGAVDQFTLFGTGLIRPS